MTRRRLRKRFLQRYKPGDWVRHTVGDCTADLQIECVGPLTVDSDAVFFTDHTHAKIREDMSWLQHIEEPRN